MPKPDYDLEARAREIAARGENEQWRDAGLLEQESIAAEIGGQKFSVKGRNVNTVLAAMALALSGLMVYMLWAHTSEAKETARDSAAIMKETMREVASAIKDMTQATREQSCLISLPLERREQNAELCKRLSR